MNALGQSKHKGCCRARCHQPSSFKLFLSSAPRWRYFDEAASKKVGGTYLDVDFDGITSIRLMRYSCFFFFFLLLLFPLFPA
jgi:hypothetical protein